MKTLPDSFVEGYKEVCKNPVGKSLDEVEEEGDAVNDSAENVFIERESTCTSSHCNGRNPPKGCKLTSLTCLHRKEISILQCAANESANTTYKYYRIGLSLGLNFLLLQNNSHRPRLEMFLAARINNYIQLTPKQFITDVINKKVVISVESTNI